MSTIMFHSVAFRNERPLASSSVLLEELSFTLTDPEGPENKVLRTIFGTKVHEVILLRSGFT
jgi:hypothetical protein